MRPILNPRTLVSVLRTVTYGSIAVIFAISKAEAIPLVDAVVTGAVLADYTTWLIRSVIQLPSDLLHGCYDGIVNLIFGWFFFHVIRVDSNDSSELVAVSFGIAKMKYIKQIHAPFMQPIAAHRIKHTTCCGRAIKCISF